MKNFNKKNKINKSKSKIAKLFFIILFAVFVPFLTQASEVSKNENSTKLEKNINFSWKIQKNNIIKNIKKEIYLNNFVIKEVLNTKINNLQHIESKEKFVFEVKNIYLQLDKYYIGNTNHKNLDFKKLREKILFKVENFSKIENLRVSEKFKKDLAVLKTVNNQKLFLKRLDSFFNEHIKDFSLRSSKINKK